MTRKQRTGRDHLLLGLRGVLMGAVNVIPGVSAGTIALITGIYEELILSLKSFNGRLLQLLSSGRVVAAWRHVNGGFLFPLAVGILISIFTLAHIMSWLFTHHALQVWAFFFGLIAGSAWYLATKVSRWGLPAGGMLLAGLVAGYLTSVAAPASGIESLWYVFLSGAISFCTLILPGISGAFVLALLGKYEYMLEAIATADILVLGVFGIGGIAGIIAFASLIGWLLKNRGDATLASLTGFMAGSLTRLWPWKEVVETRMGRSGEEVPFIEHNITPAAYARICGENPQILSVLLLALAGLGIILLFMWIDSRKRAGKTTGS